MSLMDLPLFFLDVQTTGAKPESGAHILEVAWTSTDGMTKASLVQLPNEEKIPYRIQMITGIFNEDMSAAEAPDRVFAEIEQKFKGHCCLIHFAQFEKPFLNSFYAQSGREFPFSILCTHEIAKRLFPNLPTRGIKGLAGYFGYPSQDLKRAAQQTEATRAIWLGLVTELAKQGVETWDQLQEWLSNTPKTARTKYEYPLDKAKRLALPDQPGIYRMISKWDEILYVGKATSLKDRVNSYFRGQKNRDSRKLEMLTQVYDLRVTICASPLEAALLETDEIKKWDPRYNISLKAAHRNLVFFNREFTDVDYEQSQEFSIGPFTSSLVFDSLRNLRDCVAADSFHENVFYEPIDARLIKEGLHIFCDRHEMSMDDFGSMRRIMALSLWWNRKFEFIEEENEEEIEAEGQDNEAPLTASDIADKIDRHIMRGGRTYLRSKQLTKILNSDITYRNAGSDNEEPYSLSVRKGLIEKTPTSQRTPKVRLWSDLTIDTYDRMSVLLMELGKIETQNGEVAIDYI